MRNIQELARNLAYFYDAKCNFYQKKWNLNASKFSCNKAGSLLFISLPLFTCYQYDLYSQLFDIIACFFACFFAG